MAASTASRPTKLGILTGKRTQLLSLQDHQINQKKEKINWTKQEKQQGNKQNCNLKSSQFGCNGNPRSQHKVSSISKPRHLTRPANEPN